MKSESVLRMLIVVVSLLLCSCALVELSGTMTRKTGEIMTDYSKNNDGIIAKGAGFGGGINTAVGGAVEAVAQKGKDGSSEQSKTEQFTDANKQVLAVAVDATSAKKVNRDTKANVLSAQRRLKELGYEVGSLDGIIGAKTRVAIGRFQAVKGLAATQILDGATLAALGITQGQ